MPIIFASEKACRRLLEKGIVYTFRLKPRLDIGRSWATDRRNGKKIANVYITYVAHLSLRELAPYVEQSGFESLDEWITAIKELNPKMKVNSGWLYKVERR